MPKTTNKQKKENRLAMSQKEIQDRDKLSLYVRKYVFEYGEKEATPSYFWRRINALKCGKADVCKGMNGEIIYYTFEQILTVFIMCKSEIDRALRTVNFADDNHKINLVLKIVSGNMNPVLRAIADRKEKENKEEKKEDIDKFAKSQDVYTSKDEVIDESLEEFF